MKHPAAALLKAIADAERAGVKALGVTIPGMAGAGAVETAGGLIVEFVVPGRPTPWSVPLITRSGRSIKSAKLVAWQRLVGVHARLAMGGRPPHAGPVEVVLVFRLRRRPGSAPDTDNLGKATADSLQGIVITNDRNVGKITSERLMCDEDSATIRVVARDNPCSTS